MRIGPVALTLVALSLLAVGCGGSDTDGSGAGSPTTATGAGPGSTLTAEGVPDALVGEWERVTTCAEMLAAFEEAGLRDSAVSNMLGNGFVPDVQDPSQLEDPAHPCKGAVPRKHSHFFTEDGTFGSRDWNGEQVDDGTYRVVDEDTLVISKEFPDVEFEYRIDGDTIMFDPVIPPDCFEFRCIWAVSMAYPGKKWTRVE